MRGGLSAKRLFFLACLPHSLLHVLADDDADAAMVLSCWCSCFLLHHAWCVAHTNLARTPHVDSYRLFGRLASTIPVRAPVLDWSTPCHARLPVLALVLHL